ncbi:hydroxyacylglutathione hydrolase [Mariprofundus erugo]|uniref:Hydroxyacylglutathione hydrolase n=1 Tax=Mariprofundus erugo TaxID=2528639 RepID=A0A5R9GMV6_9PROT|nr:hydroxyacylglutathione hydrolase [Mariprofundus erugo]TLS66445.1 hydroxyacylglutathione hydrolase [Mariprofundus erugo]
MFSYSHSNFIVHQLPALKDNYIYLVEAKSSDLLIAIDPADASCVKQACNHLGKPLTHIFNTHHHWDHTDGNHALKQHFGCVIIGASHDAARIPDIDILTGEHEPPQLPGLIARVMDVRGHTRGHIALLLDDALFCGDTLFGAGCGRLFEGTPAEMWHSLNKIAMLDDRTRIYCAHEYTLANLEFALAVDPDNPALRRRKEQDQIKRTHSQPTIPSMLAEEKATNPFLRPLDEQFTASYAAARNIAAEAMTVFADLRLHKDHW